MAEAWASLTLTVAGSLPGPAGNPNSVMSPASSGQSEEQQYLEKLKQLSKYIEPLRRMINKIDKNEGGSGGREGKGRQAGEPPSPRHAGTRALLPGLWGVGLVGGRDLAGGPSRAPGAAGGVAWGAAAGKAAAALARVREK